MDDWQDPDYIEEQRKALEEFSKKQKEIRMAAKKKKKKKKNKKKGLTAGEALDGEDDDVSQSQFPGIGGSDAGSNEYEEEKLGDTQKIQNITNLSKTRIQDFNDPSYLD